MRDVDSMCLLALLSSEFCWHFGCARVSEPLPFSFLTFQNSVACLVDLKKYF